MNIDRNKIKEYLYPNGVYSNINSNRNNFKKKFNEVYEYIKDDYKIKLTMIVHDLDCIPICNNPSCNNHVNIKSIKEGFRKFCSNKCLNDNIRNDVSWSEKISSAITKNNNKYPHGAYRQGNYIIIPNYCKHGDNKIYFNNYKNNKIYCEKCIDEYINNGIIDFDIQDTIEKFNEIYDSIKYKINDKWLKINHPIFYKAIIHHSNSINTTSLSEKIYLFRNNIHDIPLCKCCNTNKVHWIDSTNKYSIFCNNYTCNKSISNGELEVREFISDELGVKCTRGKIGAYNYDIICDNYIFEFNGLYWHSDAIIKDKYYHINKLNEAKHHGYELIYIWEDDWDNNRDIIKSIIRSKLKLTKRIYARKCTICKITNKLANEFISKNHIQNKCNCSYSYGLFSDGILVAVMTFGKTRMITNSLDVGYELLRYCSLSNYTIIGGASKLLSAFIRDVNPDTIISYANKDISNGNVYERIGFEFVSDTTISYMWQKNKIKYHRSNFMKHKLVAHGYDSNKTESVIMRDLGYNKIWGCGSKKYILKR